MSLTLRCRGRWGRRGPGVPPPPARGAFGCARPRGPWGVRLARGRTRCGSPSGRWAAVGPQAWGVRLARGRTRCGSPSGRWAAVGPQAWGVRLAPGARIAGWRGGAICPAGERRGSSARFARRALACGRPAGPGSPSGAGLSSGVLLTGRRPACYFESPRGSASGVADRGSHRGRWAADGPMARASGWRGPLGAEGSADAGPLPAGKGRGSFRPGSKAGGPYGLLLRVRARPRKQVRQRGAPGGRRAAVGRPGEGRGARASRWLRGRQACYYRPRSARRTQRPGGTPYARGRTHGELAPA
jgi:hypothetical protein